MARSIPEIYDALSAERDNMTSLQALQPNADKAQDLLNDLGQPTKVADWRLWLWMAAFATHILEVGRDLLRAEIDAKVAATKSHSLLWYQLRCLDFQFGHALAFNNDLEKFEYAVDDAASRIITRAATEEAGGRVIIKVAKETGKLTTIEFDSFKSYMGDIKDAGTDILFISTDPDTFKTTIDIYYDPLVMNPDGTLILDSARKPVEEQIEAYVRGVKFNGAFVLTDFTDFLQQAEGVDNPVVKEVQIQSSIDPYAVVDVSYLPYSGYYTWDDLSSLITYRPKNV